MLEPVLHPRVGQVLNLLGAIAAGLLSLLSATVTSVGGSVPMFVLAPLVALGFAIRFGGVTAAISRGSGVMGWGPRASSWACFGLAGALLGMAGALVAVAAVAAFVVLDAAAGFTKKELGEAAPKAVKKRSWRNALLSLFVVGWLGATAAFHLLVAQYFSFGTLVTWSILALGFALFLRFALVGPKAPNAWAYAPAPHRAHERREEVVVDPQRARAEDVLLSFRARGDAGPFLALVREAARNADFADADMQELERRILASFTRAGTRRDEDVLAALDHVEAFLALRTRTQEIAP